MLSQKIMFQTKKFGPKYILAQQRLRTQNNMIQIIVWTKKSKGHKTIWCKKIIQNSVSNSQDIIDLDKCPPGQMLPEQISP